MEHSISPMDRRTFLQMLLGVSAATAASSLLGRLPGVLGAENTAQDLLRVFGSLESATAVGQDYLAVYPAQASVAALTASLVGGLTAVNPHWQTLRKAELQAALRTQIRNDFADERIVKLQGWLVSLTEAQLCGLAALIVHN
ncbi:MAG: hypothetical protein R3C62_06750 [Chloroflexota bacterium]